jgi:hypothetical protein
MARTKRRYKRKKRKKTRKKRGGSKNTEKHLKSTLVEIEKIKEEIKNTENMSNREWKEHKTEHNRLAKLPPPPSETKEDNKKTTYEIKSKTKKKYLISLREKKRIMELQRDSLIKMEEEEKSRKALELTSPSRPVSTERNLPRPVSTERKNAEEKEELDIYGIPYSNEDGENTRVKSFGPVGLPIQPSPPRRKKTPPPRRKKTPPQPMPKGPTLNYSDPNLRTHSLPSPLTPVTSITPPTPLPSPVTSITPPETKTSLTPVTSITPTGPPPTPKGPTINYSDPNLRTHSQPGDIIVRNPSSALTLPTPETKTSVTPETKTSVTPPTPLPSPVTSITPPTPLPSPVTSITPPETKTSLTPVTSITPPETKTSLTPVTSITPPTPLPSPVTSITPPETKTSLTPVTSITPTGPPPIPKGPTINYSDPNLRTHSQPGDIIVRNPSSALTLPTPETKTSVTPETKTSVTSRNTKTLRQGSQEVHLQKRGSCMAMSDSTAIRAAQKWRKSLYNTPYEIDEHDVLKDKLYPISGAKEFEETRDIKKVFFRTTPLLSQYAKTLDISVKSVNSFKDLINILQNQEKSGIQLTVSFVWAACIRNFNNNQEYFVNENKEIFRKLENKFERLEKDVKYFNLRAKESGTPRKSYPVWEEFLTNNNESFDNYVSYLKERKRHRSFDVDATNCAKKKQSYRNSGNWLEERETPINKHHFLVYSDKKIAKEGIELLKEPEMRVKNNGHRMFVSGMETKDGKQYIIVKNSHGESMGNIKSSPGSYRIDAELIKENLMKFACESRTRDDLMKCSPLRLFFPEDEYESHTPLYPGFAFRSFEPGTSYEKKIKGTPPYSDMVSTKSSIVEPGSTDTSRLEKMRDGLKPKDHVIIDDYFDSTLTNSFNKPIPSEAQFYKWYLADCARSDTVKHIPMQIV